ncbi:MAG: hypothetical protein ABI472_09395 [Ginsengibacter sp.]
MKFGALTFRKSGSFQKLVLQFIKESIDEGLRDGSGSPYPAQAERTTSEQPVPLPNKGLDDDSPKFYRLQWDWLATQTILSLQVILET